MLTPLDIFDHVESHLLAQNAQANDPSGLNCLYHAPNGLKCAVGCLIPDDLYLPRMEGRSIYENDPVLNVLRAEGIDTFDYKTRETLEALQDLHDSNKPDTWPAALSALRTQLFGPSTEA